MVFNDERKSNIDFINQLLDVMELEEALKNNLADIQNAQQRRAEARKSFLQRTCQGTANLNQVPVQQSISPLSAAPQNGYLPQEMQMQQPTTSTTQRPEVSNPTPGQPLTSH